MKNIAILAAAAAVMMSGSAFAANPQTIIVNGDVTPQCAISATSTTVSLPSSAPLADASGFARTNIAADVATALDTAGIRAWCSGATNGVVLSRTAFKKGTTGLVDVSGFANGAVYDVSLSIPGGIRSDTSSDANVDGTSDGAGNGPGVGVGAGLSVDSFGPTGLGVLLGFSAEAGSTSGAITADGVEGATSAFSVDNNNRLAAGSYVSNVTVTLTPGV